MSISTEIYSCSKNSLEKSSKKLTVSWKIFFLYTETRVLMMKFQFLMAFVSNLQSVKSLRWFLRFLSPLRKCSISQNSWRFWSDRLRKKKRNLRIRGRFMTSLWNYSTTSAVSTNYTPRKILLTHSSRKSGSTSAKSWCSSTLNS